MAKILSRPMFRKGGSANNGIMDGLVDRRGYKTGAFGETARRTATDVYDFMSEMVPPPKDRSLSEMLIGGGLNLVSGKGAGEGLMANIAGSYKGPSEKFFERQRDVTDYDRKLRMTSAQTGVKHAMESIKDPKYSNTMKMVEEAIKLGKYPNTLEGRQTAWDEISRSASDWINKSEEQRFQEAKDDLIKQGYAGADLNVRAEYEAKIVPRLAEAGISYTEMGGILPRSTRGDKGPKFSNMEVGKVYYDTKDGQIKRYKGQDEATGEYLLDPIEI